MNEQLQNALSDIINKSLGGIDTATSFLQAEIPDVIKQLLLWHGVSYFLLFCVGVLLILCMIYGNYKQIKWIINKNKKNKYWNYEDVLLLNLFQLLLLLPIGYSINLQWLQILIAPKVWLIEYTAKLVQ